MIVMIMMRLMMMMMRSMINSEIGLRSITMMNEEFLSSVIKWTMLPIDQKTLFFMIIFFHMRSGSTVDLQARLVMMSAVYPSVLRKGRIIGKPPRPQPHNV